MLYIGFDPGLTGGLASVRVESYYTEDEVRLYEFPTRKSGRFRKRKGKKGKKVKVELDEIDWYELAQVVKGVLSYGNNTAGGCNISIEQVNSMPKQGVVSSFTFGGNYTGLKVILETLGFRVYNLVTSPVWKKSIYKYVEEHRLAKDIELPLTKKDQKQFDYKLAHAIWPKVDFNRGSKKFKDGLVDAALIAKYTSLIV